MKKLGILLLTLLASVSLAIAQQPEGKKVPRAIFDKSEHDFGKVAESSKTVSAVFKFKNDGSAPLIIQRVAASCGCTASDYTKEPVLPGKEGTITVTYTTTGHPGNINKSVTVISNVPDSVYTLKIKGEVFRDKK